MSKSYIELEAWKHARVLVKEIYILTSTFPKEELFGLTSQMRRCSVSVPSNIAEGVGRNSAKETVQFLYISRGSLYELETQTYISFDLNYCNLELLEKLLEIITTCKKLVNGLINYYQNKISA